MRRPQNAARRARGFISGIFNYCDRWCERCPLTARCRLFADEHARPRDPAAHDIKNAAFWRELQGIFRKTNDMLHEAAREMGISMTEEDLARAGREVKRRMDDVERDPLVVKSRAAMAPARAWLDENAERLARDAEGDEDLASALEVIEWYWPQIQVKLMRASDPDDVGELRADPKSDANGSAKVALIGIDRSIAAWGALHERLPGERDEILDVLVGLDRLLELVEAGFPRARAFVRPGFDDA